MGREMRKIGKMFGYVRKNVLLCILNGNTFIK